MVRDIDEARRQLVDGGVDVPDFVHFEDGVPVDGPSPGRADYETFLSFSDPDGNGWMIQEVPEPAQLNSSRLRRDPGAAPTDAAARSVMSTTSAVGCGGPSARTQRTSM